jgi:Alpha/beta hydrolase domain
MTVKRVIANGESQSAGLLTKYYNAIDPLHRLVDGIVFYDGAGTLRTDSPTKAISVYTEIFGATPGLPAPDSANFRHWDVAGSSHIGLHDAEYADEITARDGAIKNTNGKPATVTELVGGCTWSPVWSSVPTYYVLDSAFQHMNEWIQGGSTPPNAPRFERDTSVTPAVVRRDAAGTAIGGIRLAELEYPTMLNRGAGNTGSNFFCFITGMHQPYTRDELAARYPDHQAYVRSVEKLTAQNVASGFMLPEDAAASVAKARDLSSRGWDQR